LTAPAESMMWGGCSPTLSTMQGGNQEPKILEAKTIRMVRTDEGKVMRKQCENHEIRHGFNEHRKPEPREDYISNTLSTVQKDNIVCCAMRGRNPDNPSDRTTGSPTEQRLELGTPGVSNCLTSVQKDNMVLVKQATKQGYAECKVGGVADLSFPDSAMRRGRVQDGGEICPTIMSQNQELCRIEQMYRIRKLTPRECGRLMGVSDEDIDKMAAANSNSQLYKQFGNSIVVDVMCHMFRNLNIKQE
jgi:site-specific DNA-cytosine methylase